MEKRLIDGIEVQRSLGNVYAELGQSDAENLKNENGLGDPDQKSDAQPVPDAARSCQAHGHHSAQGCRA